MSGKLPGAGFVRDQGKGVWGGGGRSDILVKEDCGSVGTVNHLTQTDRQTEGCFVIGLLLKDCDGTLDRS